MQKKTEAEINVGTLKYYRELRGISQQALADKIGVDKGTYNRWEKGKATIRLNNQDKLAKALGKSLSALRALPPSKESPKKPLEVSSETKLALEMVASTYHVSKRDIIDIAPYLFHIVAGSSLGQRKSKCEDALAHVKSALEFAQESMPHLLYSLPLTTDMIIDEDVAAEMDAINNNQLFDVTEPYSDDEDATRYNPFSSYLRSLSDQVPDALSNLFEVTWVSEELPKTNLPDTFFSDLTALPQDHALFDKTKKLLKNGDLSAKEFPSSFLKSLHKENWLKYTDQLKHRIDGIESKKEG